MAAPLGQLPLVTPNWSMRLPGHPYDGDAPDGFLARDGSKLVNMQRALLADGRNLFVGNSSYYQKGR